MWLRLQCVFLLLCASLAAEPLRIVYPAPEGARDKRYEYYWSLLKAILESNRQQYGDYTLEASTIQMNGSRAQSELLAGREPNIIVRTTTRDLETQLVPVRIPLDKGLTGYRMFLIMPPTQKKLESVREFNDLKAFSVGQEVRWSDVPILRAAGLNVVTGDGYAGLFSMLGAGRFDLFSRGINEIVAEQANNAEKVPGIAIEQRLMLYYPLPRYFFVANSPVGRRMAERIEDGIWRLIRNGEFERRYVAHKRDLLQGLNFKGRLLFRIDNPNLGPETPLGNAKLWDDMAEELGQVVEKPGPRRSGKQQ